MIWWTSFFFTSAFSSTQINAPHIYVGQIARKLKAFGCDAKTVVDAITGGASSPDWSIRSIIADILNLSCCIDFGLLIM